MKYVLFLVAILFINLFFQVGFLNLPLAVAVFLVLRFPSSKSILFVFGLLFVSDLFNLRVLGVSFLAFALSGMLLSFFYLKLLPHKLVYSIFVSFISYIATLRMLDFILHLLNKYA